MKRLNLILGFITIGLVVSAPVKAEIVKNSAGDKIDLREDGTWVKVKLTPDDYVNDGVSFTTQIDDGNKKPVDVVVRPDITLMGTGRPLTKDEVNFEIKLTSITAQFKLKNRYSYKPREVYITQKGRDVKIRIGYTGANSYGGDVQASYEATYYIEENGKLKQTSSRF